MPCFLHLTRSLFALAYPCPVPSPHSPAAHTGEGGSTGLNRMTSAFAQLNGAWEAARLAVANFIAEPEPELSDQLQTETQLISGQSDGHFPTAKDVLLPRLDGYWCDGIFRQVHCPEGEMMSSALRQKTTVYSLLTLT